MSNPKTRIAVALEGIYTQLRRLNDGRDQFNLEVLRFLEKVTEDPFEAPHTSGSLRSEQPAAAPGGAPRVWVHRGTDYDPEPDGDIRVRDCHGDTWYPMARDGDNARLWETDETAPFTWERVLKKWGPLVEVVGPCPEES